MTRGLRLILLSFLLFLPGFAPSAHAAVVVSFYSLDFGERFPHAFVTFRGTLDATGERVDLNYGFTAKSVSPALLLGSVKGVVLSKDAAYIAKADRQFGVTVDDATYGRLMAKMREWRDREQPSYSLNKRNCVHFVMEMAETAGLRVNRKSKYMKKPKSFLQEVQKLNPGIK